MDAKDIPPGDKTGAPSIHTNSRQDMNKRKESQSGTPPEMDKLHSMMKTLEETSEQLQPLVDFHKAMESAKEDDLRILWDIRIVRGKETLFIRNQGSSSMPGALAPKMAPLAPSNIQKDISQKITTPLMNAVVDKIEIPGVEKTSEQ